MFLDMKTIFFLYMYQKNLMNKYFFISNEEKSHYVFIKDFNRFMYSEVKTKNQHTKHFCMSCLQNFNTKKILNNHRKMFIN